MRGRRRSTNEAESYFALLKRGITGSLHSLSKEHLHRYCATMSPAMFMSSIVASNDSD
jgi:hypothetical protein